MMMKPAREEVAEQRKHAARNHDRAAVAEKEEVTAQRGAAAKGMLARPQAKVASAAASS